MKITTRTNNRLEVFAHSPQLAPQLEAIKRSILRHVDDVRHIQTVYDVRETCSHCGLTWEVYEHVTELDQADGIREGQPACCDDAVEEWIDEQMAKAKV